MKVFFSPLAEQKLIALTTYLLEHWNKKVRDEFLEKLTTKVQQILSQPQSCPKSKIKKELFKCVVTKQTTFYYRINKTENEIEIVTFFDTRQHPNKLKKNLK
jgi:plasmid stabilization system protein ParE